MGKNIFIFILLLTNLVIYSQKDTIIRKNIIHFVGIDGGYTSYDKVVDFKGETNLNYIFNPYFFCAKLQLGVAPGTKFGTLKKGFISIGFSTKMDRFLSWHFLVGAGIIEPSKSYNIENYNSNGYLQEKIYTFYAHTILFESGFYIKPISNKRIIIGVNSVFHRLTISDNINKYPQKPNDPTININLSINIKLNK
jgi:hypothetical protein